MKRHHRKPFNVSCHEPEIYIWYTELARGHVMLFYKTLTCTARWRCDADLFKFLDLILREHGKDIAGSSCCPLWFFSSSLCWLLLGLLLLLGLFGLFAGLERKKNKYGVRPYDYDVETKWRRLPLWILGSGFWKTWRKRSRWRAVPSSCRHRQQPRFSSPHPCVL